ncbi:DUF4907 domain-containing protein [Crocinitomix sp.]|nr:DUF4907 domain-containing protein [Crocinitomix sp.]
MKFIFPLFLLFLFACSGNNAENEPIIPQNTTYKVEAIQNGASDWGYQILKDNQLFINQPHIPAVSGNTGFASKEKAIITGNYIIEKLEKGIMPPTISRAELDSLGVLG